MSAATTAARPIQRPAAAIAIGLLLFVGSLLLFLRLGQEFIPTLDEKNIAMHALRIPSTSLTQSQTMQLDVEKAISAFPQVSYVFSKTGTAIGGRTAGAVFEGDCSFDIVVRLPEDIRGDLDALKNLPVSLPMAGVTPLTVPLGQLATFKISEAPVSESAGMDTASTPAEQRAAAEPSRG